MIIGLLWSAAGIATLLWITLMFMWWQKERGENGTLATKATLTYAQKCARLARRGWYACSMYIKKVGTWGNRKFQKLFFALFPSAEPAFAKRDELAGLSHGPSSFFLMSISEEERASVKKPLNRKKIV